MWLLKTDGSMTSACAEEITARIPRARLNEVGFVMEPIMREIPREAHV
jgi:hypothetical protein|tara:strand:+ start:1569 stop:1712 length:144 start_codon:yes stop_codon:yes gene_type:complete